MAGTFYVECGAGFARYHRDVDAKHYNELGFDFRMGNRWTLPVGAMLGLSYCGFVNAAYLLVEPEIGWRF